MPTPRPFNAPTTFTPQINPAGEVARQVARMKELTASPASQNFLQNALSKLKGVKVPAAATTTTSSTAAASGSNILGPIGLATNAVLESKSLADSLGRGEGFARIPGLVDRAMKSGKREKGGGVAEFFNPFDGKAGSLSPITEFFNPFDGKAAPGQSPINQFGEKGINPRTNKPYSESPGKSDVEPTEPKDPPNSPDTEILSTSDSAPPSAPMPRKATTMQDVDDLYKRLGLGSYSGRTDYTQADPNASVQLPQSDTSFYLPEEKWADFKFTDETSVLTGLKLETEKPFSKFNPEAAKNMPDLFGLTPEMSGQSGLSKGLATVTPVVSNGLNLDAGQRAFLDAAGKGTSIRARDRALGLLYADGNYYTENPNRGQDGEKDWSLLKDEEARQVINGEAGAQELLKKRLAALQGETPANAAEIQAPVNVSKIASENEENANPIQQEKPKLTGNKIEDIFNPGYDGKVPQAIDLYKNFNALSEKDRERMFSVFRR